MVGIFVKLLQVPFRILFPIILIICLVGTYSVNSSKFDLGVLLGFAVLGYVFRKIEYEFSPVMIALILGPSLERAFRQSLARSAGSFSIFLESPIALVLLGFSFLLLLWNIFRSLRPTKASWEKALEEGK
jgi:putative tricarboxylic transport membrane protein